MEISIELMGMVGVIALIVIHMIVMNIKDGEINKKLSRYGQSIDSLSQQNYLLRKEMLQLAKNRDKLMEEMNKTLKDRIKEQVQQSVYSPIKSTREAENAMKSFQEEQIDKKEERPTEIN